MKIGNIELKNNIVLSPMAGVTDLAYRLICSSMGVGLVVTEMVSAKGIYYNDKKTDTLLAIDPAERPVAVQIFGSDPEVMSSVVKDKLDKRDDIDIIDINMGCPAPKIVKNGDGSALMKNPDLAGKVMDAVVKSTSKPVTVKIRMGWDHDNLNGIEIAKIAEEVGIDAITIHARTREMFYTGKADWNYIKKLKDSINIPVIGNGDIFTAEDAHNMLNETSCDGIAIGRGVQGNPWLFKQIIDRMDGREVLEPSFEEVVKMIIKHLYLSASIKGEKIAVQEMRKHIAWYVKGLPNATSLRNDVNQIVDLKEVEDKLWTYYLENK